MTQRIIELLKSFLRILGVLRDTSDRVTEEEEWIDAPEEPLTEREELLLRVSGILRWGAILNGVVALLVLIIGLIASVGNHPDLFPTVHNTLLGRFMSQDDVALAMVMLLLLIDLCVLLVLMVGALAQEFWTVPGIWVLFVANVLLLLTLGFVPALITLAATGWAGIIVWRDLRAFRVNPVALKELRGRMRGARAFVVISVYLALMSVFTILLYLIYPVLTSVRGVATTGELGRVLFGGVVAIELMLIIFMSPAFTAGAITGERERKTYDLLRTTLLPGPAFIVGKLESALSYILLLLFSAVPLQSIAFLFGGVSETELIVAFVILAITAVTLGSVGLFFSSTTGRTLTASLRTYIIALAVTFGIPVVLSIFLGFYNNALMGIASGISDSPVLETLLIYVGLLVASVNPISTALFSQIMLIEHQQVGFITVTLASDGSKIPLISPWIVFTVLYLIVSSLLLVLAVRRMRRMRLD